MMFLKKENESGKPKNDRVARLLAGQILRWQIWLSGRVNIWINRYSGSKQKFILGLFCILASSCLLIGLTDPYNKIDLSAKGNYVPVHIGEPSARPLPKHRINRSTDSLTNKK